MKHRHTPLLLLGLTVLVVGVAFLVTTIRWRLTWVSATCGLGVVTVGIGLLGLARHWHHARHVLMAGTVLMLGPWVADAALATDTDAVRLITLPSGDGRRVVSSLLPERDGVLLASGVLAMAGRLNDPEGHRFRLLLQQAYERMGPSSDHSPTPAIATYLGLQDPHAFDAIVMTPPRGAGQRAPEAAVLFLHGLAGNFNVFCWELAQAALSANLLTVCPSVGVAGDWWTPKGETVVLETLRYLRRRGITRVYLAGLSNGGVGAGVISQRHARRFAGVILISGTGRQEPPTLPVLVIQGTRDRMAPAASARRYAARGTVQYREIKGGHLIFFSEHETVRRLIGEFLRANERGKRGRSWQTSER